jgi:hypothetical protein
MQIYQSHIESPGRCARFQDASFIGFSHEIRKGDLPATREGLYHKVSENARSTWLVVCQTVEQRKLLLIFGFSLFFSQKTLETTLTGFEFADTLVHPLSFSSNAAQALTEVRSDVPHGALLSRFREEYKPINSKCQRPLRWGVDWTQRVDCGSTAALASVYHMA